MGSRPRTLNVGTVVRSRLSNFLCGMRRNLACPEPSPFFMVASRGSWVCSMGYTDRERAEAESARCTSFDRVLVLAIAAPGTRPLTDGSVISRLTDGAFPLPG